MSTKAKAKTKANTKAKTASKSKAETRGFETEAKQLLHLMIHSLYSNKEIFLRELISNASDAADKLRFAALSDVSLLSKDEELKVQIDYDEEGNTVSIADNGIGMTRDEVISHLGTIAKSGTAQFLESLTGDEKKDSQLIGQFGVGFYSAFIVADEVEVITRKAGTKADEATRWVSRGEADYSIEEAEKETHGTIITLHLKQDEKEFAEAFRLRNIGKKYADHISIPVTMVKQDFSAGDEENDKDDAAPKEVEYETVNAAKALWTRPRKELKDEEYKEFYKHVSHDFEDPTSLIQMISLSTSQERFYKKIPRWTLCAAR